MHLTDAVSDVSADDHREAGGPEGRSSPKTRQGLKAAAEEEARRRQHEEGLQEEMRLIEPSAEALWADDCSKDMSQRAEVEAMEDGERTVWRSVHRSGCKGYKSSTTTVWRVWWRQE